jgi:hypothetical protein
LPVKKDFKYAKYYEMAVEGLNNELLQTQHWKSGSNKNGKFLG